MKELKVCWFSGGVSSLIAGLFAGVSDCSDKRAVDEWIYIDIADQDADTYRYLADCEKVIGKKIQVLRSDEFSSVEDVIRKYRYINSPYGAACTGMLKKKVRKKWEDEHKEYALTYVWGYDASEAHRAEYMHANFPEFQHEFPLIDLTLSKEECHDLAEWYFHLKRPRLYDMGYPNNNCVGCVKGGMGYWNKIRKDFPEVFQKRAALEREVGHSCMNGVFLDELEPGRGNAKLEVMPDCGIFCYLALQTKEEA